MAKGTGATGETVETIANLVKPDGSEVQIPVFACEFCGATGVYHGGCEKPGEAVPCEYCVNGLMIKPEYWHKRLPFTGTVRVEGIQWVRVSAELFPYEEYFNSHRF